MKLTLNDGKTIGAGERPYFVAEVNSSHNGNMETAKRMIEAAADCGCDCVKFQSWSAESLYSQTYYAANPIAKRFVTKFSLDEAQLAQLAAYCNSLGVSFASTPYSRQEADFLAQKCKVPFIKIASMDLNNYPYLDYIARIGVPIVLSTGMGDMDEIHKAVETIYAAGNSKLCLLHCISIYPCEIRTINLHNIVGLKQAFPEIPVGFSDHSIGTEIAAAAVALGSCLIEKHLTLDQSKIGMDNQMATEPAEMKQMISQCRNVQLSLGSFHRVVSAEELEQRDKMRRSVVYTRDMRQGETLNQGDLDVKRPGTGIPPERLGSFLGKTLKRDVCRDTLMEESDV